MTRLRRAIAPGLTLRTRTVQKVSLKDFAAHASFSTSIPPTTPPVAPRRRASSTMSSQRSKHSTWQVLGISPDGAAAHQAFRRSSDFKFALLSDPDKTVMAKYGAYGEKMMYGKKVLGVIRSTFVIGPPEIEHAFYNVRADGHAAKVLAGLSN
jgi:peroxiredoxin Q/BCP